MGAVEADLPVLHSFTAGLRRDLDAVVAGLTLEYNSGAVEGTVNRINNSKRRCTDARTPTSCANGSSWPEHIHLIRDGAAPR